MSEQGSSAPNHRVGVRETTETARADIKNLNFVYEPLTDASTHIRLFRIQAREKSTGLLSLSLTSVLLPDEIGRVKYTTLSYRWGGIFDSQWILVNGKRLLIRWNLYEFLLHLNESEDSLLLWADAICINQEDVSERGLQVAIMGRIYKQSEMVIAWLEMPSEETSIVVDFVNRYKQWLIDQSFPMKWSQEDVQALYAFSHRKYWTRMWIVQELTLPHKRTLACGMHRISLSHLQQAASKAYAEAKRSNPMLNFPKKRFRLARVFNPSSVGLPSTTEYLGWITDSAMVNITTSDELTLEKLLHFHRHSLCFDPRDKVYALRGLASDIDAETLRPNYKIDVCDLYLQVLAACGYPSEAFCDELMLMLSISDCSLSDYTSRLDFESFEQRRPVQIFRPEFGR